MKQIDLSHVCFRRAKIEDLPEIIRLLSDDEFGSKREKYVLPLPQSYLDAFQAIEEDKNTELIVVELGTKIIGTAQLTFITNLTYQGGKVLFVESVRTDHQLRGQGVGSAMMQWIIKKAQSKKCLRVQLTTNKERKRAQEFYKKLGFVASHEGMKLHLR